MSRAGIRVLVTGAGAPGVMGTVFALRNNPDRMPIEVVGVDSDERAVGQYEMDQFHVIPPAGDKEFLHSILSIAKKEKVDTILPQVTSELPILAQNAYRFVRFGCAVIVSSYGSIITSNNKSAVLETSRKYGLPHPEYVVTHSKKELLRAANKLGYPKDKVVVKPFFSNGMRGVRILSSDPWSVERFLLEKPDGSEITLDNLVAILDNGYWPPLLVTEYLPGPEYTIDCFRGEQVSLSIVRRRDKIRSGISFHCTTVRFPPLEEASNLMARVLGLRCCFGFQYKEDANGVPKILECNPRVQGTMVAGALAGFNMIYYAVREAMGNPVRKEEVHSISYGQQFVRYWGGVATDPQAGTTRKIS